LANGATVFAEVIVDIPSRELGDKLFTYRVPDYLQKEAFIGAQVLVPFGHQDLVGGYVVSIQDHFSGSCQPKPIVEILDSDPLFDSDYIDFLYWTADYYCTSISSVIAAAVPADFGPRLKRVVELVSPQGLSNRVAPLPPSFQAEQILNLLLERGGRSLSVRALRQKSRLNQSQFYRALSALRQAGLVKISCESGSQLSPKLVKTVIWTGQTGTTDRQAEIISILRHNAGQLSLSKLIDAAGTTYATISKMAALGLVVVSEKEVLRNPLAQIPAAARQAPSSRLSLTTDQEKALAALAHDLTTTLEQSGRSALPEPRPWLLYGVTGSGKTEIYLRLIELALSQGRSALLLVPEISLTPQLADRVIARFGDRVAIWHSALSAGERYDTWRRLRSGDVRVLIGARSAVFASMPDLGLIILDEEHDSSYKQASPNPRYHARHLCLEKARRLKAMVLLGSATPDVGSYRQAREQERLLELPERVFKQAMPAVRIADMRQEFAAGNRSIFSSTLQSALGECLSRKEQAILLINRRGYANHVFCRACGYVVKCRNCSVSMVFHQPAGGPTGLGLNQRPEPLGYLSCHHCGFECEVGSDCPSCQSPFLRPYGLGTQRVAQEVQSHFPEARFLRLDSDVTTRRGAFQEIFAEFSAGRADILIGTQMVSKGLDIPAVTVVGVLAADAAFNLPDYRSLERGFQLLTQVSGRAGRGDRPGLVVLQTYNTELPALTLAQQHDYKQFAEAELSARRALDYPPFSQIIRLVVSGPDALAVQSACEALAEELTHRLDDQLSAEALKILGPAPCLIERLRGNFRFHLLVKNLAGEKGRSLVTSFLRQKRLRPGLSLAVDVDAFDLL